jgi:reversibly glycosylated polypeptide / UDP-arabinopyranose mutase
MKKILVVPSIREDSFNDFMKAWNPLNSYKDEQKGDWDEVILIEDNPERTFKTNYDIIHYSWKEIQENCGNNAWIFSKRDSAIRCYGFYMAYHSGADYILTLDDDCYPYHDEPIFNRHIEIMNSYERWTTSCGNMRTRGLPYKNKGKLESVVSNMGLWSGIPDLDAIGTLYNSDLDYFGEFKPPEYGNKLIPNGQYYPHCAMNFCFKREVAPLAYFPLMGQDQPYSRFDDIWFGIIFKKICDHLGLSVSVGEPFVEHKRASNVFTNLKKEAPGIEANETLWMCIDSCSLTKTTPKECMIQMGAQLENEQEILSNGYVSRLGKAMQIWASLF